jgi:hypothetical protein
MFRLLAVSSFFTAAQWAWLFPTANYISCTVSLLVPTSLALSVSVSGAQVQFHNVIVSVLSVSQPLLVIVPKALPAEYFL